MTERERLELRHFELELETVGVMSAISRWEQSPNELLRAETMKALAIEARILIARAKGIREYLDRGNKND